MGLADPYSFAVAKEGMTRTNQWPFFSLNGWLNQHTYHSNFIGINDIIDAPPRKTIQEYSDGKRKAEAAITIHTKLVVLEPGEVPETNAWKLCYPSAFVFKTKVQMPKWVITKAGARDNLVLFKNKSQAWSRPPSKPFLNLEVLHGKSA